MLADRMTATSKMVSVFRHGINNDDIGPIAKACFEETPEMFLRAARHAELDPMTGVSSNVMVGQEGYYGTGCVEVLLNMSKAMSLKEKQLEMKSNIDDNLVVENKKDICSTNSIQIQSNVDTNNIVDSGMVPDDYDLDL